MNDGWAALLFRATEVSDDALSLGVAIALAGYDLARPRLDVAALDGVPGWSVAFYTSGVRAPGHDELTHQQNLFTDPELTPAMGVRLVAGDVEVHSLVHGAQGGVDVGEILDGSSDAGSAADDADTDGAAGDHDAEEDAAMAEDDAHDVSGDDGDEGDDDGEDDNDDDRAAYAEASRRLAAVFRRPILQDLARALFHAERSLTPRLASPEPQAIDATTRHLVRVLGRTVGRGAKEPVSIDGAAPPASYQAFAAAYDFEDPSDPGDLYRELAIGRITGTLRFLRAGEAASRSARAPGAYPIAELFASSLASPKRIAVVALETDGAALSLRTEGGASREAGPTFAELLRYLALGFSRREPLEEEIVSALMLRAAVRVA